MRSTPLLAALLLVACATTPPSRPHDLCDIFEEKYAWYEATRRASERWGVPESTQLALIFQESSFRADAQPARRYVLGFIPWRRPSSAYGYGQVIESTWDAYRRSTGRRFADRDDFGDVTDFIGWYAKMIRRRTGIEPADAYRLYLAYHEGPGGYARGTHRAKPWLDRVARKVEARAARYARLYESCRADLESRGGWWPFG